MPYNQNIPQPTDQLSQSQGDLLGNFSTLYTYLNVNHANFGSGNDGKHIFVELVAQLTSPPTNPPVVPFPDGEIALYSFENTVTGQNDLYINKTNAAGLVQIPITASRLGQANPAALGFGWFYLPSGFLIKWGFMNAAADGSATNVVVNTQPVNNNLGPNYAVMINAFISPVRAALGNSAGNVVLLQGWNIPVNNFFQVYGAAGLGYANSFLWFAIGY